MFGPTGILVALIALTIVLTAVFLVYPSITTGATRKNSGLCGLMRSPRAMYRGGNVHPYATVRTDQILHFLPQHGKLREKSVRGRSQLYSCPALSEPPRARGQACYTCHADYTIYGPLKDKLQGITRLYMQYVSTPPKTIHIPGGYSNLQCLHCHAGARNFEENPVHIAMMDSLKTNQMSCLSSGCHDMVHNVTQLGNVKMWRPGQ